MRIKYLLLILFAVTRFTYSQLITSLPQYPTESDSIVIFLDTTQPGAEELLNYTGTLYAHAGVNTNFGNWQHVIESWGNNQTQPALTRLGANKYQLTIGYPREFFNITDTSEHISALALVIRSADGNKQTRPDIFYSLFQPESYSLVLNSPAISLQFGDPLRSPLFVNLNDTINVIAEAAALGTQNKDITLFVNGTQKARTTSDSLNYPIIINSDFSTGVNNVTIVGRDTTNLTDTLSFAVMINPAITEQNVPAGNQLGINYNGSATSVTLALFAPYKSFVYVLGDFNDWKVNTAYLMNKDAATADSVVWWITINNLTPGKEYAFQYLVDGNLRIADPFTEKVLDPWNDKWIPTSIYPSYLIQYPTGKTDQIVSVLQTNQTPYNWQITNFVKPDKKKLVVYELLVRDFISTHSYKTLKDTLNYLKNLGINAIELMPVMEFEGNDSWGYNTSFHMALDKYYGTKNELKAFIDQAHSLGMEVILDIVLNHAYGQNPLVRLYWDSANNRPAANNPWLNVTSPNQTFSFGFDFNHESPQTKYYVDRVTDYWISEYRIDGYRFDFTKGFTNTPGDGGGYDPSRINILERMGNKIWQNHPSSTLILEHFAANTEETVLSNFGFLLWGNMNGNYQQASMGYPSGPPGTWNLTGTSYKSRGWSSPNLVAYMESHDEERIMFKNEQYGKSNGSYNIKNVSTGLDRIKLSAAFFYTIPGPKMLWQFGELGYDISIDQGGRTSAKPILWNYYNDPERFSLYKTMAVLIKLKENYPAFNSTNFTLSVANALKRINIYDPSMDISIIGNFDVIQGSINPNFSKTGYWYDYFTSDSINVSNTTAPITLAPGEFHIYTTVRLPKPDLGIITDVEKNDHSIIDDYKLFQNYPNPFNPVTTISYRISAFSKVTLTVFDVLGRKIATLVNEEKPAGNYSVTFDASNLPAGRQELSSGVYFYRLSAAGRAGNFSETKKLILMK